jgi:hypothetical protein
MRTLADPSDKWLTLVTLQPTLIVAQADLAGRTAPPFAEVHGR